MTTLCHVICDYGIGDGAFSEVLQKLHNFAPEFQYLPLSVPAFSTLATGFWIAQLGLYRPPDKIVIFSNTAPRHDDENARDANEGERFAYAKLDNGIEIGAINAGYAFSFIKNNIVTFHEVKTANKGSQFRSRDFYPEAFIRTISKEIELDTQLQVSNIPDVPANRIAYIDGYGNIKTTIKHTEVELEPGQKINISLNNVIHEAIYSDGIFNVNHNQLVFAPGSSGLPNDPFMEISLRTSQVGDPSGSSLFNFPAVESELTIA